jgi:choice-of-anchor B domain-containing protein
MLIRTLLTLSAFIALFDSSGQDSLNMRHLFRWDDPTIPIGEPDLQNQYNEVWGYAADGREYAFIGSTLGTHVLDITEPTSTVLVDHVPGRFGGTGVVHRDYKTYAGHLYAVCDQGPSSLQIMDLQYLPDSVHVVYDSNDLLSRAHNIQIDSVNARLYTCGGSSQFSVYSIADPAVPTLLSDLEADIPWWNSAIGYVHDCHVRDNIVWCNDQDGMHVVDFTNVAAPVILGSMTGYPQQGYNHSGWLNDAGTLYAMADETHGSPLKLIEVTDLSDLEVTSTVTSGIHPTSVLHNPFFTGDLLHVAYYHDGYWLWETSDPLQPMLLGFYDTNDAENGNTYRGAWGVYPFLPSGRILVSDMQTGLWVLDIAQATTARPTTPAPRFRISPTITAGPLYITPILEGSSPARIEVIGSNGTVIISTSTIGTHGAELDLSSLADGPYLVVVNLGNERIAQRIVKHDRP